VVNDLLALLDVLDTRDVALRLVAGPGPGPLLQTDARPGAIDEDLAAAIAAHRDMVVAVLLGRAAGHAPAPCTRCGQVSLVAVTATDGKPRAAWPTCRFTPSCTGTATDRPDEPGRHVPRPVDVARTARVKPAPQTTAPKVDDRRLLGPAQPWPNP